MNSLDAAFNFQENALRLRAQRQEILAANVANADTPNYKARDFDFASALKQATSAGTNGGSTTAAVKTHPAHLDFAVATTNPFSSGPALLYRGAVQGSVDGNTVDVDMERNHFTDNAIRYEASLNSISGDIKDLMSIIQNNG